MWQRSLTPLRDSARPPAPLPVPAAQHTIACPACRTRSAPQPCAPRGDVQGWHPFGQAAGLTRTPPALAPAPPGSITAIGLPVRREQLFAAPAAEATPVNCGLA